MILLVLQSAMEKLISELKSYRQFSLKSGLVHKTVQNFMDPNLIEQVTFA
jgi:hypothetical protein